MSAHPGSPALPVLVIQHSSFGHAAALLRALESQGIPSRVCQLWEGEALPLASEISGMVSLGGPMGANDEEDHPWILDEVRLAREAFASKLPIVGICLGAQILARALGGKIAANPHPEIGWFPVHVNAIGADDPIMSASGLSPRFYQWHYDSFVRAPEGAELLAEGEVCANQAYRIGDRVYGFQFHPEADYQLVDEWLRMEGVDEEILLARIAHHQMCVQTPAEHLENAKDGEEASLRFVAAISQLFQTDAYRPVATDFLRSCEGYRERATLLDLVYPAPGSGRATIRGRIEGMIEVPKGPFLLFRDEEGLMWPVRADHVLSVQPIRSSSG